MLLPFEAGDVKIDADVTVEGFGKASLTIYAYLQGKLRIAVDGRDIKMRLEDGMQIQFYVDSVSSDSGMVDAALVTQVLNQQMPEILSHINDLPEFKFTLPQIPISLLRLNLVFSPQIMDMEFIKPAFVLKGGFSVVSH